jgi:8-oxo-dGTP pyrophosphatase MutT (NUDIX family)
MRGAVSAEELRDWISQRLDPINDVEPVEAVNSDFDLNRTWRPLDPAAPATMAAVLVPIVERKDGLTVLLTKRSDGLRNHSGQIALPGGRRDPGESLWQTALREAEEEIGQDRAFVDLIGLSSPYRTGTNFLVTPVVGFVRPGFSLRANPGEVDDIFETPFGFLMDPGNYEQHEWRSPEGATRRYYATTHEDRYIWGATAGMLRALYDRLYGAAIA